MRVPLSKLLFEHFIRLYAMRGLSATDWRAARVAAHYWDTQDDAERDRRAKR